MGLTMSIKLSNTHAHMQLFLVSGDSNIHTYNDRIQREEAQCKLGTNANEENSRPPQNQSPDTILRHQLPQKLETFGNGTNNVNQAIQPFVTPRWGDSDEIQYRFNFCFTSESQGLFSRL